MSKNTIYYEACNKVAGFQQMGEEFIRLFDKEELHLSLPSINRPNKMPVVLSKQEVIRLLKAPERILEKLMFALLEAGQNIMVLKESPGHANIQTTLIYLHIAQLDSVSKFGCMESLYQKGNE